MEIIQKHADILFDKKASLPLRHWAAYNISKTARQMHEAMIGQTNRSEMQNPMPKRILQLIAAISSGTSEDRMGDLIELEAASAVVSDLYETELRKANYMFVGQPPP